VIGLTETWLNDHNSALLNIPGYSFYNRNRQFRQHGGNGAYIRSDIEVLIVPVNNLLKNNINGKNILNCGEVFISDEDFLSDRSFTFHPDIATSSLIINGHGKFRCINYSLTDDTIQITGGYTYDPTEMDHEESHHSRAVSSARIRRNGRKSYSYLSEDNYELFWAFEDDLDLFSVAKKSTEERKSILESISILDSKDGRVIKKVNLKLEENLVKRIALLKSSGAHILFDYLTLSIEFPSSHYTVLRLVEKITDGDEAQIKLRKRKAELSCVLLFQKWKEDLDNVIQVHGKEARDLAMSDGRISEDGIPYTRVILDAGWDKRTKGHDYNAKSGHAIIFNYYTKNVLFVSSKNRYCYICSCARTKKVPPLDHFSYLNWNGSSSGMEQDMMVEGFVLSILIHGLRYLQFIGDGDSIVHQRLIERVTYGKGIVKHECSNHVPKNFIGDLYSLAKTNSPKS
ncbi:hypothetical protein QYM36_002661, partial [Artemia franciscana]